MRCYGTSLLRTQDRDDDGLRLVVDVLDNVKTKVLPRRSKGKEWDLRTGSSHTQVR